MQPTVNVELAPETPQAIETMVSFLQHQLRLRMKICQLESLANEAQALVKQQQALVSGNAVELLQGLESTAKELLVRSAIFSAPSAAPELETKQSVFEKFPKLIVQIDRNKKELEKFMNETVMLLPVACFDPQHASAPLAKNTLALSGLIPAIQEKMGDTPVGGTVAPLIASLQGRRDYHNFLLFTFSGLNGYLTDLANHWGKSVREARLPSIKDLATIKEFEATKAAFFAYIFQLKHVALCCREGIAAPIHPLALQQLDTTGFELAAKFKMYGIPGFEARAIYQHNPSALYDPKAKASADFYSSAPPMAAAPSSSQVAPQPALEAPGPVLVVKPPSAVLPPPPPPPPPLTPEQLAHAKLQEQQVRYIRSIREQRAREAQEREEERLQIAMLEQYARAAEQKQLEKSLVAPSVTSVPPRKTSQVAATSPAERPQPNLVASPIRTTPAALKLLQAASLALMSCRAAIIAYASKDAVTRPVNEQTCAQKSIQITVDVKGEPIEPKTAHVPAAVAKVYEILVTELAPELSAGADIDQPRLTLNKVIGEVFNRDSIGLTFVDKVGTVSRQGTRRQEIVGTPHPGVVRCLIDLATPLMIPYYRLEQAVKQTEAHTPAIPQPLTLPPAAKNAQPVSSTAPAVLPSQAASRHLLLAHAPGTSAKPPVPEQSPGAMTVTAPSQDKPAPPSSPAAN